MSNNSTLDRESFQQLLAAAFAVQESRMDTQSLSAVIEIQRLVAAGHLDLNSAVQIIADRTREVAAAAGVAIALLQGPQLVYLAGIGSAAPYLGRHVTATLTVSTDTRANHEILRVENAQSDARIQAAICRQLGAESLLIMPIYQDNVVTGVLEVLFNEAHAFQDREVRAYRLMAGLIGEALSRASRVKQVTSAPKSSMVPQPLEPPRPWRQGLPVEKNYEPEPEPPGAIYQIYEAVLTATGKLPALWRLPVAATALRQRVQRLPITIPQWTAVGAAVLGLVIFGWSARSGHHQPASVLQTSQSADQPAASPSAKPDAANAATQASTPTGAPHAKHGSMSAFKRVRVGENEIDYVADDVTVRFFTGRPVSQSARAYNQVEIGKDVTVRYFGPASARPVASVERPVSRALPDAEKAVVPKLVR